MAATALPLESTARPSRRLMAPLAANWWIPLALGVCVLLGPWIEGGATVLGMQWGKFWGTIAVLVGINLTLAISLQLINGIAGQFSLGHAGFMAVGAYIGGYAVSVHGATVTADEEVVHWVNPGGVLLYVVSLLAVTLIAGALAWGVFAGVRLLGRVWGRLPGLVGLAVVLWVVADVVTKTPGMTAVAGVGGPAAGAAGPYTLGAINLLTGALGATTGLYGWLMGHGAGVAGWVTGVSGNVFGADLKKPVCLVVALLGGGAMAAVVGLVVGLPTLRLRGDYLAIATLGVSELLRTAITNSEPLGRATGLSVPVYAVEADASEGIAAVYYTPWVFGVALLTYIVVWRLQHSPKGRALQCLREDEIASGAVGIDVTSHKVLAFVIGAFLAGMGGVVFAHGYGYINPKQFDLQKSIELVVMVTLGGLGSVPGTVIATVVLTVLMPGLQSAKTWMPAGTPEWAFAVADTASKYRLVVYALLLIVAMLVRSRGWLSFGKKKEQGTLASAV